MCLVALGKENMHVRGGGDRDVTAQGCRHGHSQVLIHKGSVVHVWQNLRFVTGSQANKDPETSPSHITVAQLSQKEEKKACVCDRQNKNKY